MFRLNSQKIIFYQKCFIKIKTILTITKQAFATVDALDKMKKKNSIFQY